MRRLPRWEGRLAKSRIFLIDGNCDNTSCAQCIIQYESVRPRWKRHCGEWLWMRANVSLSSSWSHPVIISWLAERTAGKEGRDGTRISDGSDLPIRDGTMARAGNLA
jgi:hypothetical protein